MKMILIMKWRAAADLQYVTSMPNEEDRSESERMVRENREREMVLLLMLLASPA